MSMGVNLGDGGGAGSPNVMSEINMTPLVDIMLVLLIIFMVTAPLLTQGVEVNLPDDATNPMTASQEPLVVTVGPDGQTYVEDKQITIEELGYKIGNIRKLNDKLLVYVRGDRRAEYGLIMKVMAQMQQAGVNQVGLVTESAN